MWEALRGRPGRGLRARPCPAGSRPTIEQGGTNVSGGQRQRLSIARALVRRPEIYVFDDSFSALDLATDARLRAALAPYTRDAAVVIVAQRVSTISTADQIVVLDDGEIVGIGTHDELLDDLPDLRRDRRVPDRRRRRRRATAQLGTGAAVRAAPVRRSRQGDEGGRGSHEHQVQGAAMTDTADPTSTRSSGRSRPRPPAKRAASARSASPPSGRRTSAARCGACGPCCSRSAH